MKNSKITSLPSFLTFLALLIFSNPCNAQTKEKGPWWPHPIWGAGDMAGGSNWIDQAKVLEAIKLVQTGKIYEMGQVYEETMPLYGKRTYKMRMPGAPTAGPFGDNGLIYNDDFLVTEIGQVGTQFDGPGHIGTRMEFEDGTQKDVYYNGFTGEEIYSSYGLKKLGVEHIKPIVTRGVLVDIAGYKGVDALPHSYEVTLDDVKGALKKQGIAEDFFQDGDAIFFNYGWSKWWSQPQEYNSNPPGIGMEVAKWVVSKNASMIGSDQYGSEVEPSPIEGAMAPVHQLLVNQNGIFNLENLNFSSLISGEVYTFLFIFTPTPFKGATGSPGRPIAIK